MVPVRWYRSNRTPSRYRRKLIEAMKITTPFNPNLDPLIPRDIFLRDSTYNAVVYYLETGEEEPEDIENRVMNAIDTLIEKKEIIPFIKLENVRAMVPLYISENDSTFVGEWVNGPVAVTKEFYRKIEKEGIAELQTIPDPRVKTGCLEVIMNPGWYDDIEHDYTVYNINDIFCFYLYILRRKRFF